MQQNKRNLGPREESVAHGVKTSRPPHYVSIQTIVPEENFDNGDDVAPSSGDKFLLCILDKFWQVGKLGIGPSLSPLSLSTLAVAAASRSCFSRSLVRKFLVDSWRSSAVRSTGS